MELRNESLRKRLNTPLFLASIMTVICLFVQSKISLYCSGIDGYLISMVSNGCYSENNYCMFVHPLLSYVCGKLSCILPYADCYSLMIICFMTFSLFCLYYLIFSQVKEFYKRAVLVLVVVCFVFSSNNGLTMRFTVQAGFCMFVGLSLISVAFHEENTKYVMPGVFCAMFGCMIREEAAYSLIPFFTLLLCYEFVAFKYTMKTFGLRWMRYIGIVIICILTLATTKKMFYNQEKYSKSVSYNSARSSLVDYPVKQWDEIKDIATEYSENDYYAVTHYVWEDSDIIDSEYFNDIAQIANDNFFTQLREKKTVSEKLSFTVNTISSIVAVNLVKFAWFEIGIVILLLSIYLFIKHKDLWVRLALFFNLTGYFIILTFFSLLGRTVALKELLMTGNLLVLFYLIFVLDDTLISKPESWRFSLGRFKVLKVILLVYITIQPFLGNKWFSPAMGILRLAADCDLIDNHQVSSIEENIFGLYKGIPFLDGSSNSFIDLYSAKQPAETFLLEETAENEEVYIWNIWEYDDELAVMQKSNKLPSKQLLSHHLPMGEWVSGQVYFKEHLESIGLGNLMKSLIDRQDTFYVGKDEHVIHQWLIEHYSNSVKMEYVKDIGSHPVWRFFI